MQKSEGVWGERIEIKNLEGDGDWWLGRGAGGALGMVGGLVNNGGGAEADGRAYGVVLWIVTSRR